MTPDAATVLLAVAGLHAGFQSTVTVAVYPALAATSPEDWRPVHAAHSRRMAVLVVPLYGAVVAACAWALLAGPDPLTWVAAGGQALAVGTTAAVAAPLHGRLGREGPRRELLRRLLHADRVRWAASLLGLLAAVGAVVP